MGGTVRIDDGRGVRDVHKKNSLLLTLLKNHWISSEGWWASLVLSTLRDRVLLCCCGPSLPDVPPPLCLMHHHYCWSCLQHTSRWGWTQTWGCSNGWAGWITERWAYSLRCWGWAEGVFSPAGILTWRLSKCGKADRCWRCREVGEAGSVDGREDRALDHFLKALHYSGSQCYKEIVTEIRFAKILMMCSSNQPWPDEAPASLWWV